MYNAADGRGLLTRVRAKCSLPYLLLTATYDVEECVYRVFADVITRERKNCEKLRLPEEGQLRKAFAGRFPTSLTPTVSFYKINNK